MFQLIVLSLIVIIVAFVLVSTSYHSQVRVLRRFFRARPDSDHREKSVIVIKNVFYDSIFGTAPLDVYSRDDTREQPRPVLVWVHGGGYIGGDKACMEHWGHAIAGRANFRVVSINYHLAPDCHYPAPLIQLNEALDFIVAHADEYGIETSRVFLGGDSAGAQIVSQYAAYLTNADLRRRMRFKPALPQKSLRGVVLCCGMYNMDTVKKSRFPTLKTFMWAYTNCKNLSDFERKDEMSTVKNVTPDYPDTFLTCGDADPFIGQAHEMVAALAASGVTRDILLYDGTKKRLAHEYQFHMHLPEADECLQRVTEFLIVRGL